MFKDKEKLYQAYHTLLSAALTWALVLVINQYFHLRVFFMVSAFFTFIPSILIYFFNLNKKNAISYFMLLGIFPILALIFWASHTNPVKWISDIIHWCSYYNGSKELYISGAANFITFAIACTGSILFYLLTRKLLAKIILAVLIFITMILLSIYKVDINKAVVCISIFYIMTNIVELYGIIINKKSGRPEKREGILYLAPVCLLLALLTIALPSNQEPIQWKAFRYVYNNVKEQIEVWRTELNYYFGNGKSEFSVNLTGYSEDNGDLSNKSLTQDNKAAMKISGLDKGKSVYLIGSVSNEYTGSSWEKTRQDFIPNNQDYFLDYIEMFYALSRQDRAVLENNRFLEKKSVRIIYGNIKTKTFFYPLKMSSFDVLSNYRKFSAQAPQINFKKARGKGTSYQSIYYEMNLQGSAFIKMLQDTDTFSYKDGPKLNKEIASYLQGGLFRQDGIENIFMMDYQSVLKQRAEMIKTQYTELPEQLPDNVYELAQDITAGCNTKYDKLKAIESYLVKNYTYSLDPQKVPEGEDFMEYFLFESKTGYCTSYATAMAVLGRCVGVPTRYVEGYVAKFETKDENDTSMYQVKNSYAHAWAEAYIEGVGWIPFEATPAFYSNRYTEWKEIPKADGQGGSGASTPYFPGNGTPNQQPLENLETIPENNNAEIISGVIISISIIIIVLLLFISYYYVLKYRYKKDYEKSDYSRKMYMQFLRILKQLKREGFALNQQETILMLSERVRDHFHYDQVTFQEVANIFMRYRYAEEAVTKEDLEKVAVYQLGLTNKERSEESRIKVWMEEFIFLTKRGAY